MAKQADFWNSIGNV